MLLSEVIAQLDGWSDTATIFASRLQGVFRPESEAVVLTLSAEASRRPTREFAAVHAPGKEYFLEVFVACEVLEGWRDNHPGQSPTLEQRLESVIFYAEHDAYPASFFGASSPGA